MYSLLYIVKQAINFRLRNWFKFVKKDFWLVVYFLFPLLFLQFGTFIRVMKQEEQRLQAVATNVEDFQGINSSSSLIFLLELIQLVCYFFGVAAIIFGLFYFFVVLQREFLLNKNEMIMKRLNGGSVATIASEFFLEQFLSLPVMFGASILFAKYQFSSTLTFLRLFFQIDQRLTTNLAPLNQSLINWLALLLVLTSLLFYALVWQKTSKLPDQTD